MRRRYKRFARNTYRYLRNRKRRRENRFFDWLGTRVLHRGFWNHDRHAIATGVAIGLAVSMLPPIPVQMLIAAILAIFLRANIPIAAAACWLSNPLTWAPILVAQKSIGDWLLKPGEFDQLHPGLHTARCIALGAVVLAFLLAPLGYFIVYALWDVIGWVVRRLVPAGIPVALKKTEPVGNQDAPHNEPPPAAVSTRRVEP